MSIKLYKENGEVVNINDNEIEKHIGHNTTIIQTKEMKKARMKLVVENNALRNRRLWNENATRRISKYFRDRTAVFGPAVIISNDP